ncbi:2-oxo-4-hydroxy-4-carboxy-5-ureidoimidazoline decarboxylase [Actinomadura sp. 9N407]|uniref:2-oxo-4-hydroxy-4-carboxy-5-ureidoimidazoline decarboxylase n=1 Tax=Actinomadura sp. 9N407 TaxID=3375154 RepID=UPI0037A12D65
MGNVAVEEFNALPAREAESALLSCCASRRWALAVAGRRPYGSVDELRSAAAFELAALEWADIEEALGAHPRIGERAKGGGREASWSRDEQSGVDGEARAALIEGNRRYEERFGHVFLICATGLGAGEMLAALEKRLAGDDAEAERIVVRVELGKIVRLRLDKLLERG